MEELYSTIFYPSSTSIDVWMSSSLGAPVKASTLLFRMHMLLLCTSFAYDGLLLT